MKIKYACFFIVIITIIYLPPYWMELKRNVTCNDKPKAVLREIIEKDMARMVKSSNKNRYPGFKGVVFDRGEPFYNWTTRPPLWLYEFRVPMDNGRYDIMLALIGCDESIEYSLLEKHVKP